MEYIPRLIEEPLRHHLKRGKSILLLGPRQTGKSTLIQKLKFDLMVSFILPEVRQRYERSPSLLAGEIQGLKCESLPLIVLDEVQKVPAMMDVVQDLIDRKAAQFILTGSSARKLRRGRATNLLPGRVVSMRLDPLVREEVMEAAHESSLERTLLFGSLPALVQERNEDDAEEDLRSYVETYLEEEVRAEALVKNLGTFGRFLELAGLESGGIVSFRGLSQEIGVSHTTIVSYYEILEDCLVAERVDPVTESLTRKKLMKSSRYLIFDLGVRRLCAREGTRPSRERLGGLLEQWVGLELIRNLRLKDPKAKLRYWRDPDGPEVDWVIDREKQYTPIEVKWSETPDLRDARPIETFLKEYKNAREGYIVCRAVRRIKLSERIWAVPWQELGRLI